MAEAKEGAGAPAKKSFDAKLIMALGFSAVNLSVMGLASFWVYKATIGYDSPAIHESKLKALKQHEDELATTEEPLIYTMDKFTVNLDGEPKRTIRVEVNLSMLSKEGFEEIMNTDNRAKTRDMVVRMLNRKSFGELESIQGKLVLKDEMTRQLNKILEKGVVKEIFFSEFIVQ